MTIHEHLDGTVSIRYGPHVLGRFDAQGQAVRAPVVRKRAAAAENQPAAARKPLIAPFSVSPSGGKPGAHRHSLALGRVKAPAKSKAASGGLGR